MDFQTADSLRIRFMTIWPDAGRSRYGFACAPKRRTCTTAKCRTAASRCWMESTFCRARFGTGAFTVTGTRDGAFTYEDVRQRAQ